MKRLITVLSFFSATFAWTVDAFAQAASARDSSASTCGILVAQLIIFGVPIGLIVCLVTWLRRKRNRTAAQNVNASTALPAKQALSSQPVTMNRSIFISYRRTDSGETAGRLYDHLIAHFGKDRVFKDVDSIPLGVDFRQHLNHSVGRCDVLLAIVGRNWMVEGENKQPRLNEPTDHLRLELEAALQRGIPVIPVLVQGMSLPSEAELPTSLAPLAYRQSLPVRPDPDFRSDVDRLIRGIEELFATLGVPEPQDRKP